MLFPVCSMSPRLRCLCSAFGGRGYIHSLCRCSRANAPASHFSSSPPLYKAQTKQLLPSLDSSVCLCCAALRLSFNASTWGLFPSRHADILLFAIMAGRTLGDHQTTKLPFAQTILK